MIVFVEPHLLFNIPVESMSAEIRVNVFGTVPAIIVNVKWLPL